MRRSTTSNSPAAPSSLVSRTQQHVSSARQASRTSSSTTSPARASQRNATGATAVDSEVNALRQALNNSEAYVGRLTEALRQQVSLTRSLGLRQRSTTEEELVDIIMQLQQPPPHAFSATAAPAGAPTSPIGTPTTTGSGRTQSAETPTAAAVQPAVVPRGAAGATGAGRAPLNLAPAFVPARPVLDGAVALPLWERGVPTDPLRPGPHSVTTGFALDRHAREAGSVCTDLTRYRAQDGVEDENEEEKRTRSAARRPNQQEPRVWEGDKNTLYAFLWVCEHGMTDTNADARTHSVWGFLPQGVPRHICSFVAGRREVRQYDMFDVLDTVRKWYPAIVVDFRTNTQTGGREVFLHFYRWGHNYDEWVPLDSERIQPLFSRREIYGRVSRTHPTCEWCERMHAACAHRRFATTG